MAFREGACGMWLRSYLVTGRSPLIDFIGLVGREQKTHRHTHTHSSPHALCSLTPLLPPWLSLSPSALVLWCPVPSLPLPLPLSLLPLPHALCHLRKKVTHLILGLHSHEADWNSVKSHSPRYFITEMRNIRREKIFRERRCVCWVCADTAVTALWLSTAATDGLSNLEVVHTHGRICTGYMLALPRLVQGAGPSVGCWINCWEVVTAASFRGCQVIAWYVAFCGGLYFTIFSGCFLLATCVSACSQILVWLSDGVPDRILLRD